MNILKDMYYGNVPSFIELNPHSGEYDEKMGEILMLQDEIIKEYPYAKEIFELLSPIKPRLIVRKDKSVVEWDSVFPESFDELSPKLRKSLISIVEEDGGRYRIAK